MTAEATVAATLGAVADLVALTTGARGVRMGVHGSLPADGVPAPAVSWQRISTVPFDDLTSGGDMDLVRVQIDFWGITATQALDMAALGRAALAPPQGDQAGRLDGRRGPIIDPDERCWGVSDDYLIFEQRS